MRGVLRHGRVGAARPLILTDQLGQVDALENAVAR